MYFDLVFNSHVIRKKMNERLRRYLNISIEIRRLNCSMSNTYFVICTLIINIQELRQCGRKQDLNSLACSLWSSKHHIKFMKILKRNIFISEEDML